MTETYAETYHPQPPHGPPVYLWLDLETSGLDPERNEILEVAVLATDERLVQIGAACSWVVWWGRPPAMDDYVREMHTKNGLLAELTKAMLQLPAIEECVLEYIGAVFATEVAGVPGTIQPILAGNTIHFDRRFIKRHMPKLDAALHYRLFDVRPLQMAAQTAWGWKMPKAEAHRALSDVLESLGNARRILGEMARCQSTAP